MKKKEMPQFLKVIYFDESTAQDYIDIVNGGRLDWSKEENKEKIFFGNCEDISRDRIRSTSGV